MSKTSTSGTPDSDQSASPPDRPGHRCPPPEYRWKKGCPSPNPLGRPPKKHLKRLTQLLGPFAATVLNHAQEVIGTVNGVEITNLDAQLRALSKRGMKQTAASRLYLQYVDKAEAENQELRREMLLAAIEHKAKYGRIFAYYDSKGRRLTDILPHPDDIVIDPDGGVRIVGPVTKADQILMEAVEKERDDMIRAGEIFGRKEGRRLSDEDARRLWAKSRRKFYDHNGALPPRLKRKFPKFEI